MQNSDAHQKDGTAVAAILAAAFGCAVIGLATVFAEASPAIKDFLTWSKSVGPLSGKTGMGVICWLVAWGCLHLTLRTREVSFARNWRRALVLLAVGLLGTFPPIFEFFAPH